MKHANMTFGLFSDISISLEVSCSQEELLLRKKMVERKSSMILMAWPLDEKYVSQAGRSASCKAKSYISQVLVVGPKQLLKSKSLGKLDKHRLRTTTLVK